MAYKAVLLGLSAVCSAASLWPAQSYVTENFLTPELNVTRNGTTAPGYLFYGPYGPGSAVAAAIVTTDDGELVWHGPSANLSSAYNYQNVRKAQLHDKPVLTYWYGYSLATFGHGYGSVAVIDETYQTIANVCVPNTVLQIYTGVQGVDSGCYHDQHESYLTNQGTIITTAYNTTQADLTSIGGPKNGWILDGMFHEINITTNEVLFTWRSTDYPAQIPLSASHQVYNNTTNAAANPWDWFHINSVQPLDDGYLVNSRHLYTTYKVSKNGTIEWIINGGNNSTIPGTFTQDADVYFSWQHFPRVVASTNTTLTLDYFNNDNAAYAGAVNSTSGLELLVDLEAKHVSLLKTFINNGDKLYANSQGDVQYLGSVTTDNTDAAGIDTTNYLQGYGQLPILREWTTTGSLLYQANFGPLNTSNPATVSSYRTYKYSWTGVPYYPPKIASVTNASSTTLYISWNGATDVTSYNILAGTSASGMKVVASVPKTGFETSYVVPAGAGWKYVQVQALNGTVAYGAQSASVVVLAGNGTATGSAGATGTVAPYKGAAAALTTGSSVVVVVVAMFVGAIVL